ncbi:MAG: hypothetical protein JWO82_2261 [Akkermansiaceae bacterium]|nr:hypothetical protein [Akkermansiaceae bacterium]
MTILKTIGLLTLSNIFMTFAWYGHLKDLKGKPWIIAALISWGIALFEYMIQVPANRIGSREMSLGQLKILQEVITLTVFVPFVFFYMKKALSWNYAAAALCMAAAAFFIFRDGSAKPADGSQPEKEAAVTAAEP